MKTISWIVLGLASMGLAKAQEVPPLPPMRGDMASLKDTMKFIQDKLPGKVNYIVYTHDNVAGTDAVPNKQSVELSNVSADASRCSISFHERFDLGKNGTGDRDNKVGILLKQVREIVLMQQDQSLQGAYARAGHPELSAKVDPAITIVVVRFGPNESAINFKFYDATLSDRVSKALQHAVELCGGGNQDPF